MYEKNIFNGLLLKIHREIRNVLSDFSLTFLHSAALRMYEVQ